MRDGQSDDDLMNWLLKRTEEPLDYKHQREIQLKKIGDYSRFILLRVTRCGCKAAIRQMDRTYPVNEPPELPFAGCDQPECHCVYEGIVDRRSGQSRRYRVERRRFIRNQSSDRRMNHGRRKGDQLMGYRHF